MPKLTEKTVFHILGLLVSGLLLTNCAGQTVETTTVEPEPNDDTLTVWWERGYYAQEDTAIKTAIANWQAATGQKAEIALMDQDTILKEAQNALQRGNPPDLIYSHRLEETFASLWAKQGQLADLSEVIAPVQDLYSDAALKSVLLYNDSVGDRSIYAVPIDQKTMHIHYSRTLLQKAGFTDADIPTEWDAFWDFWQQAQDRLRQQGNQDIYGIGLSMSVEAGDTYNTFEQMLEIYDVYLLDSDGNLLIDDPAVRQGVVTVLDWYTDFYKAGYVPPSAVDWRNRDNNIQFLNQNLLMVVNLTMSIPASQREDEAIYYNDIATILFPNTPDGDAPRYRVSVQQTVVFNTASNKEMARDFLAYLIQPDNLSPYLKGTLGRFFPVMPQLLDDPFWTDPADPHVSIATQQYQLAETYPSNHQLNVAYTTVQTENIWGQAIEQVVVDNVPPEEAAEAALNRIAAIFEEWEQ